MIVVSCICCRELFEIASVHEAVQAHCRAEERDFCRGSGYTGSFEAFAPEARAMRPGSGTTMSPPQGSRAPAASRR